MNPFLSMILLWPCNFAPSGWAFCDGSILSIAQNTALFSLLGTFYGGNGTTNFALPDFRGRIPVGTGSGPGLQIYTLGEKAGAENVSLLISNLPAHIHPIPSIMVSSVQATNNTPAAGNSLAAVYDTLNANPIAGYNTSAPNTSVSTAGANTGQAGNGIPISNLQPFTSVNYIIALQGIFPSRS